MKKSILLFFLFLSAIAFSQPQLKPRVGSAAKPADNDAVCAIQTYLGNFDASGYQKGDTVPNFTLYTSVGDSMNIAYELAKGKPVLLVAGSYTCPVYRGKIDAIHNIAATYANQISVFIVYVVEAHPIIDVSPYSGQVWTTSQNQTESVLYRQPTTYAERKVLADTHIVHLGINVPVLIDGPCNDWWKNFGPAPNNAYLIQPNGKIFSKHGWFNKAPDNMKNDIDSLLGNPNNSGNPAAGSFTFNLVSVNYDVDVSGTTMEVYGWMKNKSNADVEIDLVRTINDMQAGWSSSMCTDVCLAPFADSAYVYLYQGDSLHYTMYIYSASVDTGHTQIKFVNKNNPLNAYTQDFYGYAIDPVGINKKSSKNKMILYPNPVNSNTLVTVFTGTVPSLVKVMDQNGRTIFEQQSSVKVTLPALSSGCYFVQQINESEVKTTKLVVE